MNSKVKNLQIWADNFKEGEWLTNLIISSNNNFTLVECKYKFGFQPIYIIEDTILKNKITLTIFGDYDAWNPKPKKISDFLEIAKPDIIVYNHDEMNILFAVEETDAVPTGNQSLQRLERVWWAAEEKVPFIYLIPEYGLHKDGGVRTTSIWPLYLGIKLSIQYNVPSLVLLFSDKEHPEDYNYGDGLAELSKFIQLDILSWLKIDVKKEKEELIKNIFQKMGDFIKKQKDEISSYLPGEEIITNKDFLDEVIKSVVTT